MLDRQPAVIAVETQSIAELTPPFFVVAISHGDIAPSAISYVLVSNSLQAASPTEDRIIHHGVLCVHVMNRVIEVGNRCKGVATHPKQVTWVEIRPDDLPNLLPEFQKRRNVINELMPMHLNTK